MRSFAWLVGWFLIVAGLFFFVISLGTIGGSSGAKPEAAIAHMMPLVVVGLGAIAVALGTDSLLPPDRRP